MGYHSPEPSNFDASQGYQPDSPSAQQGLTGNDALCVDRAYNVSQYLDSKTQLKTQHKGAGVSSKRKVTIGFFTK